MNASICPACGCSLLRLGIVPSLWLQHRDRDYFFCCAGCRELFVQDPERCLQETGSLEVCPVCLAEKPAAHTVRAEHEGRVLCFCRCPHCLEEFHRRPAHYLDRLDRRVEHPGVFGGKTPCAAPAGSPQRGGV